MDRPRTKRLGATLVAAALAVPLLMVPANAAPPPPAGVHDRAFEVEVLSGPADMVTAGTALVSIEVPRNVPVHQVRISVDGRDVADAFETVDDGRTLLGVVSDLALGDNLLEVRANGQGYGRPSAEKVLTNHPAEGPVFSGPHIHLYCSADSSWGLGEVDENCHVAEPTVTYVYRTTGGSWADLPEGELPDNVAVTETIHGDEVPYIVRVERGTINRAVYEIALLHEPGTPVPDPWTSTPGWNDRLVYTFGGACGIGHTQATSTGGVMNDRMLSRGYAVASATFNVFANNCNDVTSAETAMMVKEHLAVTYGAPLFTMGSGGSAGTMQQLLIANAYPGILDGVLGNIGYPDERSTTVTGHECRFITGALNASDLDWTNEQGRAVVGFATFGGFWHTCAGYMFFDGVDYPMQCPGHIPAADRYHPTDNPDGIRCAMADFVSNVYGTDPETGFGRPIIPDTVGVQYGLEALQDGIISAEQFVDLNERIGGLDAEGQRTEERSRMDVEALTTAYETGRVNQFDGGLTWTPIIETRGYSDLTGDFHDHVRSWSMRERLLNATGDAHNHVSWVTPSGPLASMSQVEALEQMEAWLTARTELARTTDLDEVELTRQSKPDGLVDGCWSSDGERIDEELTLDPDAACNQEFPFHANPRMAAGGPASSDVLACSLTDLDADAYGVEFTADQWDRLEATFPDGVCDWTQPGIGQVGLAQTWIRF
jgi:hypothetical protein